MRVGTLIHIPIRSWRGRIRAHHRILILHLLSMCVRLSLSLGMSLNLGLGLGLSLHDSFIVRIFCGFLLLETGGRRFAEAGLRWAEWLGVFGLGDEWVEFGLLRGPAFKGVYSKETANEVCECDSVVQFCRLCRLASLVTLN